MFNCQCEGQQQHKVMHPPLIIDNSQLTIQSIPSPCHLLVIAYGNRLRRDDGAGIALAERVVGLWCQNGVTVHLLEVQQLTPELAPLMAQAGLAAVIFFDCAVSSEAGIELRQLSVSRIDRTLGHHLLPQSLAIYAAKLYQAQATIWLVTIAGSDFGLGEGYSASVEEQLTQAMSVSERLLEKVSSSVGFCGCGISSRRDG